MVYEPPYHACSPNMVTVRVCSKLKTSWKSVIFTNKVGKNALYFVDVRLLLPIRRYASRLPTTISYLGRTRGIIVKYSQNKCDLYFSFVWAWRRMNQFERFECSNTWTFTWVNFFTVCMGPLWEHQKHVTMKNNWSFKVKINADVFFRFCQDSQRWEFLSWKRSRTK